MARFSLKKRLAQLGWKGETLYLAVSGGRDSLGLMALALEEDLPFVVAHFNHCTREECDAEEALVRRLAHEAGRQILVGHGDGRSAETAARHARQRWFATLIAQGGLVVTAHHQQDQAGTLALNLSRGSGLRGLAAIPPRRDGLLHPLLDVKREVLEEACLRRGWRWVDDPTNDSPLTRRVQLRGAVEVLGVDALARSASRLRSAVDWLDQEVTSLLVPGESLGPYLEGYDLKPLRQAHPFLRSWALESLGRGRWPGLPWLRLEALTRLVGEKGRFFFDWGPGQLVASEGVLHVGPCAKRRGGDVTLCLGESKRWGGWVATISAEAEGFCLPLAGEVVTLRRGEGLKGAFYPEVVGENGVQNFESQAASTLQKPAAYLHLRPIGPWEVE